MNYAKTSGLGIGLLLAIIAIALALIQGIDEQESLSPSQGSTGEDILDTDIFESSPEHKTNSKPVPSMDSPLPPSARDWPLLSNPATVESAPGLANWITDSFLAQRPDVEIIQVIEVDNHAILSNPGGDRVALFDGVSQLFLRTIRQDLPGGGIKWGGSIDGIEDSSINIEISPGGETLIRATLPRGRVYVRPSPMLPFHVVYRRRNNLPAE